MRLRSQGLSDTTPIPSPRGAGTPRQLSDQAEFLGVSVIGALSSREQSRNTTPAPDSQAQSLLWDNLGFSAQVDDHEAQEQLEEELHEGQHPQDEHHQEVDHGSTAASGASRQIEVGSVSSHLDSAFEHEDHETRGGARPKHQAARLPPRTYNSQDGKHRRTLKKIQDQLRQISSPNGSFAGISIDEANENMRSLLLMRAEVEEIEALEEGRFVFTCSDLKNNIKEMIERLDVIIKEGPSPSPRHSRASSTSEENLQPLLSRLESVSEEVQKFKETVNQQLSQLQREQQQDLSNFIAAAERRIAQTVTETLSGDLSQMRIGCITERNKTNHQVSTLEARVNEINATTSLLPASIDRISNRLNTSTAEAVGEIRRAFTRINTMNQHTTEAFQQVNDRIDTLIQEANREMEIVSERSENGIAQVEQRLQMFENSIRRSLEEQAQLQTRCDGITNVHQEIQRQVESINRDIRQMDERMQEHQNQRGRDRDNFTEAESSVAQSSPATMNSVHGAGRRQARSSDVDVRNGDRQRSERNRRENVRQAERRFRRASPPIDPSSPSDSSSSSPPPRRRQPMPAPRRRVPGSSDPSSPSESSSTAPIPAPRRRHPRPEPRRNAQRVAANNQQLERLRRKVYKCGNEIKEITDIDLSRINSKSEILEVTTYDAANLSNLKEELKNLERKLEEMNSTDENLWTFIEDLWQSAKNWEFTLSNKRRGHHLHLSGERNLLRSVDLSPFTGSPDGDTVYSFLETFFRFSDSTCSPRDQAVLLVSTYLSDSIKKEVESFKEDIERIKSYLINKYGDLRYVAESRLRSLGRLKQPSQSPQSKMDYLKKVSQCLLQVEALSRSDLVNQEEITGVIFNSTYVKSIVSNLPDDIIESFSRRIESESAHQRPSGKRYFEVLQEVIDLKWRQIDMSSSIKAFKDQSQKPVNATVAQEIPNISAAVASTESSISFSCPCDSKSKPHEMGFCQKFMSASNKERFQMCRKNLACVTCFKPSCYTNSKQKCISTVPKKFLCQDCKMGRFKNRPLNIFNCSHSKHKKPTFDDAVVILQSYIKAVDRNLTDNLKPAFNLSKVHSAANQKSSLKTPPSKSSPADPATDAPIFDTESGRKLDSVQEIKKEGEDDSVYIFQSLNVSGEDLLLFYDSGASGNLCKGQTAERLKFKTMDPTNQRISGVSNFSMWTGYGTYTATFGPDQDDVYWELALQGISKITSKFPKYDWGNVNKEVRQSGCLPVQEPLPPHIGGKEVDILLGIKIPQLIPKLEFTLPNGLAVFRCAFRDTHGSNIAYGGSHPVISAVNKKFSKFNVSQISIMLSQMTSAYMRHPWTSLELSNTEKFKPLTLPLSKYQSTEIDATAMPSEIIEDSRNLIEAPKKVYLTMECDCEHLNHGEQKVYKSKPSLEKLRQIVDPDEPVVDFRCENCENCPKCKASPALRSASVRDRIEQKLIEESVRISYLDQKVFIKLPFTMNPTQFLKKQYGDAGNNYQQALKKYNQQCRTDEVLKNQIRLAMNELIASDFIEPIEDASYIEKEILQKSEVQHYHLWHAVKKDSISTPCRLVTDSTSTMLK